MLGGGKQCLNFAKEYLERRSIFKNRQRALKAHNDDLCKPAVAITPNGKELIDSKVYFNISIYVYTYIYIINIYLLLPLFIYIIASKAEEGQEEQDEHKAGCTTVGL